MLTDRANARAGEWVAIHGTGGIGPSALLLAKMLGAQVVVVDIVEEKLTQAKSLGADASVNAANEDVAAAIREITGGGAQVSIEALGIAQTTNASVGFLATLGRHVHAGIPRGMASWKSTSARSIPSSSRFWRARHAALEVSLIACDD